MRHGMCKLPPVSTPQACGSARECLTESWREDTGGCWDGGGGAEGGGGDGGFLPRITFFRSAAIASKQAAVVLRAVMAVPFGRAVGFLAGEGDAAARADASSLLQ